MPEALKGPEKSIISEERVGKPSLTVEAIRAERDALEKKIEEARVIKDKDIAQKLSGRESLIGEAVRNDELILAIRDTIEYYRAMKTLGELRDPDDIKKLEEYENTEKGLVEREAEIKGRIFKIARHPEVKEKLTAGREKEAAARKEEKRAKETKERLEREADILAEEIIKTAERKLAVADELKEMETKNEKARQKVRKIIEDTRNRLGEKSLPDVWNALYIQSGETTADFLERLEKKSGTLRFWRGKEKAAIDFITVTKRDELEAAYQAEEAYKKAYKTWDEIRRADVDRLAEQLRSIIKGGSELSRDVSWQLRNRIRGRIYEFADIERKDPKDIEKLIGRYQNLEEAAGNDPRLGSLKDVWETIHYRTGYAIA